MGLAHVGRNMYVDLLPRPPIKFIVILNLSITMEIGVWFAVVQSR